MFEYFCHLSLHMEFCYACVIRDDVPLVQHCPQAGNFDLFFQKYAEKNKIEPGKTTIISDGYYWGILAEPNGLIFVCVAKNIKDPEFLNKALDDIKNRFLRINGNDWKTATSYSLQSTFEQQLITVKESIKTVYMAKENNKNNFQSNNEISNNSELDHQNLFLNKDDINDLDTIPFNEIKSKRNKKIAFVICGALVCVLIICLIVLFKS